MGKVFICYFDASVVDLSLAYEAVLQNFTAEDKSKILYIPWKVSSPLSRLVSDDAECVRRDISWSEYFPFLPMIDMDTANMSCIFLNSSLALRYGATPVLIFDQPCGGKPRRSLTMSHLTVSHGPSSLRVGGFHTAVNELSWLHGTTGGRIGPSTIAGSGLCSEFCHTHADWQGHRQSSPRTFSCRCCP